MKNRDFLSRTAETRLRRGYGGQTPSAWAPKPQAKAAASAVRGGVLVVALCISVPVAVGQLLDKVVARVDGTAITQSDVQTALGLGLVEAQSGQDPIASGTRQMIDRQLMLTEVARFPPPEPADSAIADAVAQMKTRAGTRYEPLIRQTGLDEQRLRELARETLRIEAYVNQRFGTTESAERRRAMVAQWIEDLRIRGDVVEVTSRP